MNPMSRAPAPVPALTRVSGILSQVALELAFVEPGKDTGLLPINSLVMDLEELPREGLPPGFSTGLVVVRTWLDRILDGEGMFSAASIQDLNRWHAWMSAVATAAERGGPAPEVPAEWGRAGAGAFAARTSLPVPAPAAPPPPPEPSPDEPAIRLNLAEDSELLREFHGESLELLQNIEHGVLVLEQNPSETETLHSIFRAFHTFKGGAGFLHLAALRDLAHELESLLDLARRSELKITSGIIDLILAGADALRQFTHGIGLQLEGQGSGSAIVVPTRSLILRVRAALRGEPDPALPVSVPSVSEDRELPPEPGVATPGPREKPVTGPAAADGPTGFVKLDTRKLDSLVDLVGELVIAQSMVIQDPDVQRLSSRSLVRSLRQLGRITSELQRNAMSLRMVPIRTAFQKMNRLVRDLAARQDKQVELVLEGEETELDRSIVEQLGDPLVHMIRNALDHGVETPAVRVARGKPPVGTIRLSAAHQRGGIVIRIQDDGQGLDPERLLAKARERGLVPSDATPGEAEIFLLIFAPGFSTAETITDVSGRGVGMDVVRRNIEKLRGRIEIQSAAGRGTTFTLLLPLTLAIIDGLIVGLGDERYIIPTLSVRESFRPRPGMVSTVHERGEVVSVRGRLTPLLRLGNHLGTRAHALDPTDGIVVVVESGDGSRGLLVDRLIGKQEVVIKSLGESFKRNNLLAGAAILGDGRVGLILDVDTLVKSPVSDPGTPAPTLS